MRRAVAVVSAAGLSAASVLLDAAVSSNCVNGPCGPGNDHCGAAFQDAPAFHLMDQGGCAENDPNGPVYDPVHGVFHLFYQDHLSISYGGGRGPDYGHWVSRDFVHWAQLPVGIWNGFDVSTGKITPYDTVAIYTGSATVVPGFAPDGRSPGVVQIYPGLCEKEKWSNCSTGTGLAVALPADYRNDPLLTNWTKPSYNPIMNNTQRDPSTAWKTPYGEWRLRTFDRKVYGSASDADVKAGKWYEIGVNPTFTGGECPSFYPLPAATPGFEAEYDAATDKPTHVMKYSGGGDWTQLGTYVPGKPRELGNFSKTPGWEELYQGRRLDMGNLYASKDQTIPKRGGGERRINWGWAQVPPASTQTLPREVTFNAVTRQLEWAPVDEMEQLRGPALVRKGSTPVRGGQDVPLGLPAGAGNQSEVLVTFELPKEAGRFGVVVMAGSGRGTYFYVDYTPPSGSGAYYEVQVGAAPPAGGEQPGCGSFEKGWDMPGLDYNVTSAPDLVQPCRGDGDCPCQKACMAAEECRGWTLVPEGTTKYGSPRCCLKSGTPRPVQRAGLYSGVKDTAGCAKPSNVSDVLRLTPAERTVSIRVFVDNTFSEAYFQNGRVALTWVTAATPEADVVIKSDTDVTCTSANVWPVKDIWVTPEQVLATPRRGFA